MELEFANQEPKENEAQRIEGTGEIFYRRQEKEYVKNEKLRSHQIDKIMTIEKSISFECEVAQGDSDLGIVGLSTREEIGVCHF